MSKAKKSRQQTQEIERTFKLIDDGLKEFQVMWQDFETDKTSKLEQQLRAQLQKLQKLRSQVRMWQEDQSLKDYHQRLLNSRQLIEAEMSRFRVSERNMRKGSSDGEDGTLDEALVWIKRCITNINVEINQLEGNSDNKKQKKIKEQQASVYREHLAKFEEIHNALENGILQPDDIDLIKTQLDEFIEDIHDQYTQMDFDVYEPLMEIIQNGGHNSDSDAPVIDIHIDEQKNNQVEQQEQVDTKKEKTTQQQQQTPEQPKLQLQQQPQPLQQTQQQQTVQVAHLSLNSTPAPILTTQPTHTISVPSSANPTPVSAQVSHNSSAPRFKFSASSQQPTVQTQQTVQRWNLNSQGSSTQGSTSLRQHKCPLDYDKLNILQFSQIISDNSHSNGINTNQPQTINAFTNAQYQTQKNQLDQQHNYIIASADSTGDQAAYLSASSNCIAKYAKVTGEDNTQQWNVCQGRLPQDCFDNTQHYERLTKAAQQIFNNPKYNIQQQLVPFNQQASTTASRHAAERQLADRLPAEAKLHLFHMRGYDRVQELCRESLRAQGWRWIPGVNRLARGDVFYDPYTGQMLQVEGAPEVK